MLRLLGPVEVSGSAGVAADSPRQRLVLAALGADVGRVVPVEVLLDRVWGAHPPDRARRTLQAYLARTRRLLEDAPGDPVVIEGTDGGYVLRADPSWVDLHRFRELASLARDPGCAPESRVRLLREAVGLWRAQPLVGLGGTWVERMRALWGRERVDAMVAWAEAELAGGDPGSIVGPLVDLVDDYPLDEALAGALMRVLAMAGRTAEALTRFEQTRSRLIEELGIDPGAELRAVHQAVLRGQTDRWAPAVGPVRSASSGPVPALLPASLAVFAGRVGELADLDALAVQAGTAAGLVVLSGAAGVGKTSLAVHWAHRVASNFPDGQLYVNLRGFDPTGAALRPEEAIGRFLRALEVPKERIPAELDRQVGLYRSLLAGRRVLVVLDNARDAEQVRPLLPGGGDCLVLITSRDRLAPLVAIEGVRPVVLDVLTEREAHDLLVARLGADRVAAEPGAVAEIVERCGRLPLALAIAAAHAAVHPDAPLASEALQLREAEGGLDLFDGGDASTDVRAVFSWSYRALPAGAARLFRLLGLHSGPDLAVPAAASLAGVPLPQVRRLLRQLEQTNLLIEHTPGRYRCHDLLHSYAAELTLALDEVTDRRAALHRILNHYLHTAHAAVLLMDPGRTPFDLDPLDPDVTVVEPDDREQALAWFAAEHASLLAAIDLAASEGFDRHVWILAWSLTTYFDWRGHWHDLVATQTAAMDALVRLGDRSGQAHVHRDLGRTYAQLGRHDEAHAHLDEALRRYDEIGDVVGQARTRHNLGWLMLAQERHREALAHSEAAHHLFEQAGDVLWQARTLSASGWLHAQLGDYKRTLELSERALALMRQLQDRHGEAAAWDNVGFAHHHLGDHDSAIRCYQWAVDLFVDLGDRAAEAEVLTHLGEAHDANGDRDAAHVTWRRALAILDELDHPGAQEIRQRLG